jgi:hypothetical protein
MIALASLRSSKLMRITRQHADSMFSGIDQLDRKPAGEKTYVYIDESGGQQDQGRCKSLCDSGKMMNDNDGVPGPESTARYSVPNASDR